MPDETGVHIDVGLYEKIITESLEAQLATLDPTLEESRDSLRRAEAGDRLAVHLSQIVASVVDRLDEKNRVDKGLELSRKLIELIVQETDEEALIEELPVLTDTVLTAITRRNPDGSRASLSRPLIPLLDTTLLTNSPGEPRVGQQLFTEVESASQIDLVMAFVRTSGIRPLLRAFQRHCDAGKHLRVLTTTYTNTTEQAALEKLQSIGADVRVSYDKTGTRLHAKAWLFHRPGGMSTAYIGSSNLTHQAQRTGLEWNVRVSGVRNPSVIEKVAAVFNAYWESGDFEEFDSDVFAERTQTDATTNGTLLSPVAIRLFPFQERLLEQITIARDRGQNKNLLVSATGTGKTVMAAVDYARIGKKLPRARLLFVAHTVDILNQSLATFRHAIHDGDFGELWVAGQSPSRWNHVFASIQSISAAGLNNFEPDHFDIVIIDEVHHGAADSYTRLLNHINPKELLGLTATPERADGLPILDWFSGGIAAELRLWDAIDQHRLVPFEYYGVHDNSDLSEIRWSRGSGYDIEGLTNLYTANDVWANLVIRQLQKRVQSTAMMRALGFCVSIVHAQFMARKFNEHGINAAAIWGNSPKDERALALRQLNAGEINILFSVDIFNEGVDVPNVETLLFLRPTDSPVLFLQQLGRGLRKAENKSACLVLDFVGQHRKEFRFHRKLQAFLGGSRKHVEQQVKDGFPFLPAGCHMELEPKAREIVLQNIRNAVPSNWPRKVAELRELAQEGVNTLASYLEHSGLELTDVYQGSRCWSDLKDGAGLSTEAVGPNETVLRKACGRMLHVDDEERLGAYRRLLTRHTAPQFDDPSSREARIARMLVASICGQAMDRRQSLNEGLKLLWQHPQVRSELRELFGFLKNQIDHHHIQLITQRAVPLQIHARYTRLEILAALDPRRTATIPTWREGVRWLPEAKADVLAFTLDKTSGQFSPTTRYKDYAINSELIHWESQSTTRADSVTGLRYRSHIEQGSDVFLFARETAGDRAFWFLGPGSFVSFKGEKPMAITWRLKEPLPGDLYASFAAAVA